MLQRASHQVSCQEYDIEGAEGLQSGISYCGARNIKEMQKNAEFIQITFNGWEESLTKGNKLSE